MTDLDDNAHGNRPADANDMEDIRAAMSALPKTPPRARPSHEPFVPRYDDLESWVHEFFVLTFGSAGRRRRWCDHWWDHPEAVLRLDALWRTWEVTAQSSAGMSAWIHGDLDPSLTMIFHTDGPFSDCSDGVHRATQVLPVVPPPAGLRGSPRHWWELPLETDQ